MEDILSEQDALELDQEEVHKLLKVLEESLNGLLGDSVVAARAESTGDSSLEDDMASNLDGGGHCTQLLTNHSVDRRSRDQLTSQRHVQELEGPAEERQITGGEDETDHAGVGNGGRTGLFPLYTHREISKLSKLKTRATTHAQKAIHQRVVV